MSGESDECITEEAGIIQQAGSYSLSSVKLCEQYYRTYNMMIGSLHQGLLSVGDCSVLHGLHTDTDQRADCMSVPASVSSLLSARTALSS